MSVWYHNGHNLLGLLSYQIGDCPFLPIDLGNGDYYHPYISYEASGWIYIGEL